MFRLRNINKYAFAALLLSSDRCEDCQTGAALSVLILSALGQITSSSRQRAALQAMRS